MSRVVIGYVGEGRARRPIYVDEGPSAARLHGYTANASTRGYAVIGGQLVRGESPKTSTDHVRAWRARQRGEGA